MIGDTWLYFLLLMLLCLVVQAFFSMLEMAAVSFNKVRLQYYVNKKNTRALWLSSLLNHPSRLFGTTLIGVNAAMQFGSEFARRFYESLGVSPDWAPLSQVFIVLVFAELAPMFAARRYAEHVAMLGMPILYISSRLLTPCIWVLNGIIKCVDKLFGISSIQATYINREELQKAIEEKEESTTVDPILTNIFSLKAKTAIQCMRPLGTIAVASDDSTVAGIRKLLEEEFLPFLPVFRSHKKNIVGVVYPRDLLKYPASAIITEHIRPPWFISESSTLLQILEQFKRNQQSVAIVLNKVGLAIGLVTLDAVIDEIFGQKDAWVALPEHLPTKHKVFVERSFSGETTVAEVDAALSVQLPVEPSLTLEEAMARQLGAAPEIGQSVRIGQYELRVIERSLITGKEILLTTRF